MGELTAYTDESEPDLSAVISATRQCIVHEYVDGDLAVRFDLAPDQVEVFWALFPEVDTPAFVATAAGSIQALRGQIIREGQDGGLSIRIKVLPRDKAEFRRLWPRPGKMAVICREDPASARARQQAITVEEHGEAARELRLHIDFMGNPEVWAAVGSDSEFLEWLRDQPCAACGFKPIRVMDDVIRCEAAHVRRVGGEDIQESGTGFKGSYSAIPLCPGRFAGGQRLEGCHAMQHRAGEGALEQAIGKPIESARLKYVHAWLWQSLKRQLGHESMKHVPPAALREWAIEHDVVDHLPALYRNPARLGLDRTTRSSRSEKSGNSAIHSNSDSSRQASS